MWNSWAVEINIESSKLVSKSVTSNDDDVEWHQEYGQGTFDLWPRASITSSMQKTYLTLELTDIEIRYDEIGSKIQILLLMGRDSPLILTNIFLCSIIVDLYSINHNNKSSHQCVTSHWVASSSLLESELSFQLSFHLDFWPVSIFLSSYYLCQCGKKINY